MSARTRCRLLWRIARHEGDVYWMVRLLLLCGRASANQAMTMLDDYEGHDPRRIDWWTLRLLLVGLLLLCALWPQNTP